MDEGRAETTEDRGRGVTKVVKQVYQTSDGEEYETEAEAEGHQAWVDFCELVAKQPTQSYCRSCDRVGLTDFELWRLLVDRREDINALLLRADKAERDTKSV